MLVDSDGGESQKNPEPGMFDVLRGEYPVESVCRYSQDSRVARLGRGRAKAGMPEAGGTSAAWQMLARMRRSFEIVVIDGGSLSDDLTASVLVPLADETVIVASLNSTPMSDVNAAVQAMSAMGRLPTCAMLADEAA